MSTPVPMLKPTIKNILVDLDGTLVYTERANIAAYERAFSHCGLPFDSELFKSCFGLRFDAMIEKLAPHTGAKERDALKEAKQHFYPACFEFIEVNKPLVNFLQSMKSTCTLALVTTAREKNALSVLEHLGITGLFSVFVFGDSVARGKPAPDGYLKALELLGATAESSLAFEDSDFGVAAAQAAGISVLRVA